MSSYAHLVSPFLSSFGFTLRVFFFLQPIVEGLRNCQRRVSDRPSWILMSKTPASISKIVAVIFVAAQAFKAELKAEPDFRYTNLFRLRRNAILGTHFST